jgi:hypothetical protein
MKSALLVCAILFIGASAGAQSLTGTYTSKTEDGDDVTLKLEEHSDKTITGSMAGSDFSSSLSGRIDGSGAIGTVTVPGYPQPLRFVLRRRGEQQLVMSVNAGGEEMPPDVFTRVGGAASVANPDVLTKPQPSAAPGGKEKAGEVRINGVVVPAELLRTYQQRYNLRVIPGDYWYDRMCGAWGVTGGPALGIVPAGLEWGGKLREDASNGDTGVFVNGRELSRLDVAVLQQITIVIPGRYWMNAHFDYGYEGGPMMGNFLALIQSAATPARREGILSTYDKTGATVIGGEVLIH